MVSNGIKCESQGAAYESINAVVFPMICCSKGKKGLCEHVDR